VEPPKRPRSVLLILLTHLPISPLLLLHSPLLNFTQESRLNTELFKLSRFYSCATTIMSTIHGRGGRVPWTEVDGVHSTHCMKWSVMYVLCTFLTLRESGVHPLLMASTCFFLGLHPCRHHRRLQLGYSSTLSSRLDLSGYWPGTVAKREVWLLRTWFGNQCQVPSTPVNKLVSLT